jgi:hypothetical protein
MCSDEAQQAWGWRHHSHSGGEALDPLIVAE